MTEFSECNTISLKSYASFPDFFSRASMKIIELGSHRKQAWFFNCNTQQIFYYNAPGISCVVFFFFTSLSLHPNLTAEYECVCGLAGDWRNWHHPHDCSFPSSNLSYLRAFLNKKACVLWKWALYPTHIVCVIVINTQSCLTDIVMAGCAERVHWLICLEMTCST